MASNKSSPAKQNVLEFIKVADNALYTFEFAGNEHQLDNHIKTMRVNYSRIRARAIERARAMGKKVKEFSLCVVAKEVIYPGCWKVSLRKNVDYSPFDEAMGTFNLSDAEKK